MKKRFAHMQTVKTSEYKSMSYTVYFDDDYGYFAAVNKELPYPICVRCSPDISTCERRIKSLIDRYPEEVRQRNEYHECANQRRLFRDM